AIPPRTAARGRRADRLVGAGGGGRRHGRGSRRRRGHARPVLAGDVRPLRAGQVPPRVIRRAGGRVGGEGRGRRPHRRSTPARAARAWLNALQTPGRTAMSDEHDNHGQTPAAWTTVIIIMVASVVATVGIVIGSWPMFWVGIALVVVGA